MTQKYNKGDKVVPHAKSVGCSLGKSSVWNEAKGNGQKFLYVTGYDGNRLALDCDEHSGNGLYGDHFLESDVTPYNSEAQKEEECMELSLKDLIALKNSGFINDSTMLIVRRA
jgi:hypothetical protein